MPAIRNRLHFVESLVQGILQTSPNIASAIGYPLQHDSKTLLLKTSRIYIIEYGEIEFVLNCRLHLY